MVVAAVNYGEYARDPPEGTWSIVIQMNTSSVQLQYSLCMYVYKSCNRE